MCGGKILICPCSRVGHIKKNTMVKLEFTEQLSRNKEIISKIWFGNYERFYVGERHKNELEIVKQKLSLKEWLKCKPFDWYIKPRFWIWISFFISQSVRAKIKILLVMKQLIQSIEFNQKWLVGDSRRHDTAFCH